jgi:hypothetical protein
MLIILTLIHQLLAQDNIKYEFKKYEKFDLGDMSVKGDLIAPGDLSVRERAIRTPHLQIYERENFENFSELRTKLSR